MKCSFAPSGTPAFNERARIVIVELIRRPTIKHVFCLHLGICPPFLGGLMITQEILQIATTG